MLTAPRTQSTPEDLLAGRLMVHGGLSEHKVFAQAAVLEISSASTFAHPSDAAPTDPPLIQLQGDGCARGLQPSSFLAHSACLEFFPCALWLLCGAGADYWCHGCHTVARAAELSC
jgi:hypothetical protein